MPGRHAGGPWREGSSEAPRAECQAACLPLCIVPTACSTRRIKPEAHRVGVVSHPRLSSDCAGEAHVADAARRLGP
eukprot:2799068-Prymnesium_polylepis.1